MRIILTLSLIALLSLPSYSQVDLFGCSVEESNFSQDPGINCDLRGYATAGQDDCSAFAYTYVTGGFFGCAGVLLNDASQARLYSSFGGSDLDVRWAGTISIQLIGQIWDQESFSYYDTYNLDARCCDSENASDP